MDWAMKFLPSSGREPQSDFYGKRGIPWHISYAYIKKNENDYATRTYVHVFDTTPQDSQMVTAILVDVLKRVRKEISRINAAYL